MDPVLLSRLQFGGTAAFHILWPLLSIGLSVLLFFFESMWLATKDERYYRQVRFWAKVFVLTFGLGVASGIPLEFQFGSNWATFSKDAGDILGVIVGFESTTAFAVEAVFLGIFMFGWNKVGPKMHLFSNAMVMVGATLSAFWIMVANTWMQVPRGVVIENGVMKVVDYATVIANYEVFLSFTHMVVACVETTMLFVAGVCAWAILREKERRDVRQFFLTGFKVALAVLVVVVPLQIILGDMSGKNIARVQPEKLAAIELHWETNKAGSGAPWSPVSWPNKEGNGNSFETPIPNGLSLLITNSTDGTIRGLNEFPASERPTTGESIVMFYAFRIMVAIGFFLCVLVAVGVWFWKKGFLAASVEHGRSYFWRWWVWAIPLGFIATEAGWMVREIGRQPWTVYHLMRTTDSVSPGLSSGVVLTTSLLFLFIYVGFLVAFVYALRRIVGNGPDLESPLPNHHSS